MYAIYIYIYGNIYHQYTPNVSIYTIHGSYGLLNKPFVIPLPTVDTTKWKSGGKKPAQRLRDGYSRPPWVGLWKPPTASWLCYLIEIWAKRLWYHMLVGGFNPSEKYESVGMIIPNTVYIYIYGKITNVPNHQPVWHLWCMTIIDIQCGAGGHQTAKLTPAFVNLHFATTFVGQLEGGEKAKTARIEEGRQCNDPRPT